MSKPILISKEKYPNGDIQEIYVPYRVCPIGAHSDHQYGKVLGFAIDKGVTLTYSPTIDGSIQLSSFDFLGAIEFSVFNVPEKQGDWGDYLRGVVTALLRKYPLEYGIKGLISGSLPVGGLSSSASVCLCYLTALSDANSIKLSSSELIELAYQAEKEYVGINVGTLDMSCEVLCEKDKLLYLDTKKNEYELIERADTSYDFEIAVFFSGMSRNLSSGFNMRVDEVKTAAYSLMAYSGIKYGLFNDARLRDVPKEVFLEYRDKLPDNMRKRAEHFYSEYERVELGSELFRKGDIIKFGELVFKSGYSSIHNWETGSPELIYLYDIMTSTDGIYGGRFSGAGFNGCSIAIIDPSYEDKIKETVTKRYLAQFPQYKDTFSVHFCETDNGVGSR